MSLPLPVFASPDAPARTAVTVPDWPSNAMVSWVSVPDCTVPPVNDTLPVRVKAAPPRSSTPPAAMIGTDAAPSAEALPATRVPAETVAVPEIELDPDSVSEPVPVFVRLPAVRLPENVVVALLPPSDRLCTPTGRFLEPARLPRV